MKHLPTPTALACAVLVALPAALPTLAHADVDYVDIRHGGINLQAGRVTVHPVNGRYGQISNAETVYPLEMKAGCKGINERLTDTFVALGNAGMNGGPVVEAMPPGTPRTPVAHRGNQSMDWVEVDLKVPTSNLGGSLDPVAICNAWVDQRLAQGALLHQILAQDKTIVKPVTLSAVAACGKNGQSSDWRTKTLAHQFTVVCKAGAVGGVGGIQAQTPTPPPPALGLTKNLAVVASSLNALTPNVVGQCPAKVQFQAEIQADAKGEVDYTVVFPPNANTPQQQRSGKLVFQSAGTRKTPIFEFNANTGYPTGTAVLTLQQAGENKAYANFKVQCVQGAAGNQIQMAPKPSSDPNTTLRAPATPPPPSAPLNIQVQPASPPPPAPLNIQMQPASPPPPPPAAPSRSLSTN
jgi:hypothetical protein